MNVIDGDQYQLEKLISGKELVGLKYEAPFDDLPIVKEAQKENPKTFQESKEIAKDGGSVAGNARIDIEKKLGKPVLSSDNFLNMKQRKRISR